MVLQDNDRLLIETFKNALPDERGGIVSELHDRHSERIQALCMRYARDEDEALDVAQEAFLSAFSNIDDFRGESCFSTWLYRIAVRKCIESHRRREQRLSIEFTARSDARDDVGKEESADPALHVESVEHGALVREAVSALPRPQRRTIEMRYFQGLPYERIAAVLRVPVGTVKSRLFRAHQNLALALGGVLLTA